MDLDLWLKLLDEGEIYCFDNYALAGFRHWQESKTIKDEIKFLQEIKTVLLKHGMTPFSYCNRKLHISTLRKRIKNLLRKAAA